MFTCSNSPRVDSWRGCSSRANAYSQLPEERGERHHPRASLLRCLQLSHLLLLLYQCLVCFFQRFNADYELSAREGADTMAYIALMDEKLRPALVVWPSSAARWRWLFSLSRVSALHSCTLSGWMRKTTSAWRGRGLRRARRSRSTLSSPVAAPTPPSPASSWPKGRPPCRESLRWRRR